jgi:ribosomal protein S18 acetylase RimI-like enzyme
MTITVTRSGDQWIASRAGEVIGELHPWLAPDRKLRLFFDTTDPSAYGALIAEVDGPCLTTVDEADREALEALTALGFIPVRREVQLEIPVTRTAFEPPAGYRLISAAEVPTGVRAVGTADTGVRDLMALDDALRADVPGAEGWESDETSFREQTYDSPYFDPDTYLVAVDAGNSYVGLVRIWNGPRPLPRLGLIGVLSTHRRRGLARALISAALNVLATRGESIATAEADDSNTASRQLLNTFGATEVGAELALARQ